ncbi:2Fe-2S iron-sulfur cluster-binding protein [Streptomyces apocyni]|uniref:2Fe-2S iron-sulfur cluster-binding protein n=1 Tax=Streptomyces apocyni TaxID=2654677 RepID=UPI001E40E2C7|nr:2Fe-2S iron-sulfur cluster-binding protein [Streptomyces apocyni]
MSDTNGIGADGTTGEGSPGGGWQPTPPSDYDADATAFVALPEGLADTPLAAPGSGGFVPPQISVAGGAGTDPAATGTFVIPGLSAAPASAAAPAAAAAAAPDPAAGFGEPVIGEAAVRWPEPNAPQPPAPETPGATGQWTFTDAAGPAAPANVTGQWSIPLAQGNLPDESGEFTKSSLMDQWSTHAPPTLPGGAPAPWAQPHDAAPGAPHPGAVPGQRGALGIDAPPGTDRAVPHGQTVGQASATARDQGADHGPNTHHAPGAERGLATGHSPGAEPGTGAEHGLGMEPETGSEHGPRPERIPDAGHPPGTDHGPGSDHGPGTEHGPGLEQALGTRRSPGADDGPGTERGPGAERGSGAEHGTSVEGGTGGPGFADERPLASYVLRVNGADRPVTDAWIGESLLYVLRERLGLAGAKDGCSQGECGACAVQVDGRLVASCLVPGATSAGSEVRTVEGLAADGQPSDVQCALAASGAVQCGFCAPGMAMTVHDLLEGNPAPGERETRQALCGNLCRCTGYRGVLDAVNDVVAKRGTAAAAATATAAAAAAAPDDPADQARVPHQAPPGAGGVAHRHPHDGGQA